MTKTRLHVKRKSSKTTQQIHHFVDRILIALVFYGNTNDDKNSVLPYGSTESAADYRV